MAKKDFNQPKHGDIDTKNLYVCGSIPCLFNARSSDGFSIIGHQGLPVPAVSRLHQDPFLVAVLLLHPDS